MGRFISGDVVVLDFPFSDLSRTKRRPALVIASLKGDDLILCQITSQAKEDEYSVRLDDGDFVDGTLRRSSRIRPNRLFTADSGIVVYRAGHVSEAKLDETKEELIRILRPN
ncbi:MAG: type II toxin-antitoxin system PemK/MazF family toxin [Candidatus Solibacter usitatus]|nr:type II toxin-antitoxin system PemK/MazF family toxin [Candidatus Solibacter usitatus]